MNTELMFSSKTDMWSTPQDFFDRLDEKYHFNLDVCATAENAKCELFITEEQDTLKTDWFAFSSVIGKAPVCFMNPPYQKPENACSSNCKKKGCEIRGFHIDKYIPGQIDFIKKAYNESLKGCTVVCLLPARTDTEMFHDYCMKGEVEFIKGRLKFGNQTDPAPFPSMLVVFKP